MKPYGKTGREFYRLAARERAHQRVCDTILILAALILTAVIIWEVL